MKSIIVSVSVSSTYSEYTMSYDFRTRFRNSMLTVAPHFNDIFNIDEIESLNKLDDNVGGKWRDTECIARFLSTVFVREFPDEPFFFSCLESFILIDLYLAKRERCR